MSDFIKVHRRFYAAGGNNTSTITPGVAVLIQKSEVVFIQAAEGNTLTRYYDSTVDSEDDRAYIGMLMNEFPGALIMIRNGQYSIFIPCFESFDEVEAMFFRTPPTE